MIRVIVVEPKYQVNLGHMARVLKNFGVRRMELVNPRCRWDGKEAIKYSKHARELLERARIWKSLKSAVGDSFVVGTTGIWAKSFSSFYNVYTPEQLVRLVKRNRIRDVSLVIGRDDIGMKTDEIAECDALLFVDADKGYPILNISHALTVALYFLTKGTEGRDYPEISAKYPGRKETGRAMRLMRLFVDSNSRIRDKGKVYAALSHVLKRANPTKDELQTIAVAIAPNKRRPKK
ncbi:MAG: RNA methyltransferase [Candidatus Micrarchaeota archaeon]|nr:RNA methyltransferase [Candidatus Micrarchaeota archaeon]